MSEYSHLVDTANVGADCKKFLSSQVGNFLIAKAKVAELSALRELANTPPEDRDTIYKLQLKAAVPRNIVQFIDEAIREGALAEWQIAQFKGD